MSVDVTNPGKELFPGITKERFVAYYEAHAEEFVRHAKNVPAAMYRFPDGIHDGFFQKQVPDYFPKWIDTVAVKTKHGPQDLVLINSKRALTYIANQAAEVHLWTSTADKLRMPQKIVFDLDPSGVPFASVKEAAVELRNLLARMGSLPFVMTTGGKGLHVVVPLRQQETFDAVKEFARHVAETLVRHGHRYTLEIRKEKREGKIFIDYLRNEYGQTSIAPYAVRARENAPVAMPLSWQQLPSVTSGAHFTLLNARKRSDPWKDFGKHRTTLKKMIQMLEVA